MIFQLRCISFNDLELKGNGCGAVGRMVASDIRVLRFSSQHGQNIISQSFFNIENEEKEAGLGPLKKRILLRINLIAVQIHTSSRV